jgi:hypothetical protein
MFRFVILFLVSMVVAEVAREGANPAPYDVINVALESETSEPIAMRRSYEEARFESETLARIAERKAKANKALATLLATEKAHAQAMHEQLGFLF